MSNQNSLSALFVIQAGSIFGTGHLKRSLLMAQPHAKAYFFVITDLKDHSNLLPLLKDFSYSICAGNDTNSIMSVLHDHKFDLIVADCAALPEAFVQRLNTTPTPLISFDNKQLGLCSEIHIAALPSQKPKQANFQELYHTPIRAEFFQEDKEIPQVRNILITLGGSDPKKNAVKLYKALKDTHYNVTIIKGVLTELHLEDTENIKIVSHVDSLLPYITKSDLVICGPGNTMLEVMAAKKYLVVMPHTSQQASDLSKIHNLPVLSGGLFLSQKAILNAIDKAYLGKLSLPENFDFATWWNIINQNIASRPAYCPLCNSSNKRSVYRDNSTNQYICNNCQSSYLYHLTETGSDIDPDLIISNNSEQGQQDYKINVLKQREDSKFRIQIIKKILLNEKHHHSLKLLDIGAKHGIFVQESNHNGFSAQGVELSEFARRHAMDNWNIPLIDSMDKAYEKGAVNNIVTVWDHMELLPHPLDYLKKLSALLQMGGLLVFRVKIKDNHLFTKGFFRITEKGGKYLAERAGFIVAQTSNYEEKNQSYLEFYCLKQSEL